MKPTISNAFNEDPAGSAEKNLTPAGEAWEMRKPQKSKSRPGHTPRPPKSLAASLAPMQADLRETEFGFSMELSPMQAADALEGLNPEATDLEHSPWNYLVSMEQSAWRDGEAQDEHETPIGEIALRLAIPVIEQLSPDELVMDELSLRQLVSLCQPTRLLIVAVEGPIEKADAVAMDKAIASGLSPLMAEMRAVLALEVLGDRSVVLHCRDRERALGLMAQNFRHYLAALHGGGRPMSQFGAPETWQLERLLSLSGSLTIRPIETQMFSTSIDVGINTSKERFRQPADRSLIYDLPSNTWHDEP